MSIDQEFEIIKLKKQLENQETELENLRVETSLLDLHQAIEPYIAGGSEYTGRDGLIRAIQEVGDRMRNHQESIKSQIKNRKQAEAERDDYKSEIDKLKPYRKEHISGVADAVIYRIEELIAIKDDYKSLYEGCSDSTYRHSPKIVCLCGSTRFMDAFQKANLNETLAGNIVLTIGVDMKSSQELFAGKSPEALETIKQNLDKLHKHKIERADEVLILNVDGYIGDSTRSELEYAQVLGKIIRYLEPLNQEAKDKDLDAKSTHTPPFTLEGYMHPCSNCCGVGTITSAYDGFTRPCADCAGTGIHTKSSDEYEYTQNMASYGGYSNSFRLAEVTESNSETSQWIIAVKKDHLPNGESVMYSYDNQEDALSMFIDMVADFTSLASTNAEQNNPCVACNNQEIIHNGKKWIDCPYCKHIDNPEAPRFIVEKLQAPEGVSGNWYGVRDTITKQIIFKTNQWLKADDKARILEQELIE